MSTVLQTMQTKVFQSEVQDLGERKMAFIISTSGVDRDGDSIGSKGWHLKNFVQNPVVLWAHDHSQLPIARATKIWATDSDLRAEIEFPPRGTYQFADTVHDMVRAGFLNATSVGFAPIEYEKAKDRERGYDFKSQELLEFSIVPIPANPAATVIQRGLNSQAMKAWLGQSVNTEGSIDWTKINGRPQIDWDQLNHELESRVEVAVDTKDVLRVIEALEPAMKGALRAGLRAYAEDGARKALLYMSGRLD